MQQSAQAKIKIAAIDDDFNVLSIIEKFLQPAGFEVTGYRSAAEAVEKLPDLKPACILLDNELPDMRGIDLCRKLFSMPELADIPIIFLSASTDRETVVKALVSGARDYINKPFNTNELITRIETHVELYLQKLKIAEQNRLLEKRNQDNIILSTRSLMLQEIIKQYTPRKTWEKADFSALEGMISIQDEEIELVFMFMDISGFTAFSEKRSAREVIASLNSIFGPVTEIIYALNGDVDKYIGDNIFSVFENPLFAVKAALKSKAAIDAINQKRQESGLPALPVRTGLNMGRVIRGNIGGSSRKEIALIGDSVNVASRLERACPPGKILISEYLFEAIKTKVKAGGKCLVRAKGKTERISARFLEALQ